MTTCRTIETPFGTHYSCFVPHTRPHPPVSLAAVPYCQGQQPITFVYKTPTGPVKPVDPSLEPPLYNGDFVVVSLTPEDIATGATVTPWGPRGTLSFPQTFCPPNVGGQANTYLFSIVNFKAGVIGDLSQPSSASYYNVLASLSLVYTAGFNGVSGSITLSVLSGPIFVAAYQPCNPAWEVGQPSAFFTISPDRSIILPHCDGGFCLNLTYPYKDPNQWRTSAALPGPVVARCS